MSYALTFASENFFFIMGSLFLTFVFATIVYFDFRYLIIPDWINGGLFLAGAAISASISFESFLLSVIAAASVAAFFYGVAFAYARLRSREGLGMGDVKFLAAASTWVGITGMPWLLLIASSAALVHVLCAGLGCRKFDATTRIPFGPHLAMGLILVWHFQKTNFLNGSL